MVEKIKNWVESKWFFDNLKESMISLKNQILGKDKEENLENKKNIVVLKELENKIIDKKLVDLEIKQNKSDKIESKPAKSKPDLLSKNNIYLNYGINSDNPVDKIRWEESINLLQDVANYKNEKNVFANAFGWIADKLLNDNIV